LFDDNTPGTFSQTTQRGAFGQQAEDIQGPGCRERHPVLFASRRYSMTGGRSSDKKVNWSIFIPLDGREFAMQGDVGIMMLKNRPWKFFDFAEKSGRPTQRMPRHFRCFYSTANRTIMHDLPCLCSFFGSLPTGLWFPSKDPSQKEHVIGQCLARTIYTIN
jgi:hypothetical protein